MSGVVRGPAGNNDCRIYVGNLPPDIRTKDVEDVFYKYGTIRDIDLKNRRGGPPFAFIEFEDPRLDDTRVHSVHRAVRVITCALLKGSTCDPLVTSPLPLPSDHLTSQTLTWTLQSLLINY
uniref:Serine/arginine-rich splicing factor 1-like n=1 Tax=Gouania willdenowi TaxID=441366 RepID=A0A8C5DQC1_GOUWI